LSIYRGKPGREKHVPLDLFSTSPTVFKSDFAVPLSCPYKAPFFAYQKGDSKTYGVVQGNCNHWDCPVHGIQRAKEEYGRIVHGSRELAKTGELYFLTITCRGLELPVEEAVRGYLGWTNRLLDALRADWNRRKTAKKNPENLPEWSYVQVTERQKRGHPHSHILTTYYPRGLFTREKKTKWYKDNNGKLRGKVQERLGSEYLKNRVISAGLGEQYDISKVVSAEAVSRYVAKYMFKSEMFTRDFPKNWKRIRYAESFPKLPDVKTNAFPLITREDWGKLASLAVHVVAKDETVMLECQFWLRGNDVLISQHKETKNGNGD